MNYVSVQRVARNEAAILQARAKAIRESQRGRLDSRHGYMLELVADRLSLDTSIVEDFMLDGDQVRMSTKQCVGGSAQPCL